MLRIGMAVRAFQIDEGSEFEAFFERACQELGYLTPNEFLAQ